MTFINNQKPFFSSIMCITLQIEQQDEEKLILQNAITESTNRQKENYTEIQLQHRVNTENLESVNMEVNFTNYLFNFVF